METRTNPERTYPVVGGEQNLVLGVLAGEEGRLTCVSQSCQQLFNYGIDPIFFKAWLERKCEIWFRHKRQTASVHLLYHSLRRQHMQTKSSLMTRPQGPLEGIPRRDHPCIPLPEPKKEQNQQKSSYIHMPTFRSLLYVLCLGIHISVRPHIAQSRFQLSTLGPKESLI